MRQEQEASIKLMREILGADYLELRVEKLILEEDLRASTSKIRAEVAPSVTSSGQPRVVEGAGVGIVDAFFHGLVRQYSPEYPSLESIRFVGFSVKGVMDPGRSKVQSLTDAEGEVRLLVENSEGRSFEFLSMSRSITGAALQTTLDAVEYFVNSERSFLVTRRALDDAKARGRPDLVQSFANRLMELVRNTSYTDTLARK